MPELLAAEHLLFRQFRIGARLPQRYQFGAFAVTRRQVAQRLVGLDQLGSPVPPPGLGAAVGLPRGERLLVLAYLTDAVG
jgi:hypothetical protein